MDFNDLKGMFGEVKTRMDANIDRVRKDMANVRTGRASAGMLDNVHVEAYGSRVPLRRRRPSSPRSARSHHGGRQASMGRGMRPTRWSMFTTTE
jgi:hypothetical protein